MLFKLAGANFKRSLKDYTIYFLTLLFGVCLFYVFNSMDSQQVMLSLSQSQKETVQTIIRLMSGVSVFIAVILGFLIVYANRFLIKRRKKELGVYLILGMEKKDVALILMIETLLIGFFALAAGLITGVLASQGLAVFTAELFQVKIEAFRFVFSKAALMKTVIYFGLIFVIVIFFNLIWISRNKLVDLLLAAKKNERLRVRTIKMATALFLLSVICLGTAYQLLWPEGYLDINLQFGICIALGIIGTFLFFLSLSGFLLRALRRVKGIYYRGLNMFVLRQVNAKITTTFISMTILCLMLLLGISMLSMGMSMARVSQAEIEAAYPADYTVVSYLSNEEGLNNRELVEAFDVLAYMRKNNFPVDEVVADVKRMDVYSEIIRTSDENGNDNKTWWLIPLSQFNEEMKSRGQEPLALKKGQVAVNTQKEKSETIVAEFAENGERMVIYGKEHELYPEILDYSFGSGSLTFPALIVPDEAITGGYIDFCFYNFTYKGDEEKAESVFQEYSEIFYNVYSAILGEGADGGTLTSSKLKSIENSTGTKIFMVYLTLYVGVTFFITSAAVLALQQLCESSDNMERYTLLRKLGVEEGEINRSLLIQIGIYFLLPLSLALVHSYVGIRKLNEFIRMIGHVDIFVNTLYWGTILAVIYGIYIAATYWGSKIMVRSRK